MEPKPSLLFVDPVTVPSTLVSALSLKFHVVPSLPQDAAAAVERKNPDVIVLNIHNDIEAGAEICRRLAQTLPSPSIPLMVLSQTDHSSVRISLFRSGADDFLALPVDPEELAARIEARLSKLQLLRQRRPTENVLNVGRLRLDLDRVEVRLDSQKIPLGPVEFKILSILARSLGQLRSRDEIEAFVWGEQRPASRALDPHINALRKKLYGSDLELRTVYGAGYTLRRVDASTKVV